MKKTLNINLAGYPFTIDEDAYNLLKDYLDTIRYAYHTSEDTEDLAADIESRFAEILIEKENGGVRIVSVEEISNVISRIGKPSEFIEIDESDIHPEVAENQEQSQRNEAENFSETGGATPPPYESDRHDRNNERPRNEGRNSSNQGNEFYPHNNPLRKKLFRDPQNSLLGGVCSGLAIYLNLDITIVRLITVALFFLSASVVAVVYIVLWLVVPAANTPFQRMQMMGEDPTVENIGRKVTEDYYNFDARNYNNAPQRSGFWKFVYNCCNILVKCLVILVLCFAIPIILALIVMVIACIVALCFPGEITPDAPFLGGFYRPTGSGAYIFHLLMAVIGVIITISIPCWLFYQKKFKSRDINTHLSNRRSLLVLWIAGIALAAVFIPKTAKDAEKERNNYDIDRILEKWDIDPDDIDFDDEDIQELSVDRNGIRAVYKDGTIRTITRDGITIERKESVETPLLPVSPESSESPVSSDETKVAETDTLSIKESLKITVDSLSAN